MRVHERRGDVTELVCVATAMNAPLLAKVDTKPSGSTERPAPVRCEINTSSPFEHVTAYLDRLPLVTNSPGISSAAGDFLYFRSACPDGSKISGEMCPRRAWNFRRGTAV